MLRSVKTRCLADMWCGCPHALSVRDVEGKVLGSGSQFLLAVPLTHHTLSGAKHTLPTLVFLHAQHGHSRQHHLGCTDCRYRSAAVAACLVCINVSHICKRDLTDPARRALSRSDKKILHIDENDYYGGAEAAFSLQEAVKWSQRVTEGMYTPFLDVIAS
jgi:hypothetical protein